jgi:hypothetical protein
MKTYMVKRAFWKISKKKKTKSSHPEGERKEFRNRHIFLGDSSLKDFGP